MICPHCHNNNREGAKFCDECGMPLTNLSDNAAQESDLQLERNGLSIDELGGDSSANQQVASNNSNETAHDVLSPLVPVVLGSDGKKLVSADTVGKSLGNVPEIEKPAPSLDGVPEVTASDNAGDAANQQEVASSEADFEPNAEDIESASEAFADAAEDASLDETSVIDVDRSLDETSVIDVDHSLDETSVIGLGDNNDKQALDADITTNLSGLDVDVTEVIDPGLLGAGYNSAFRDGHTMEMPAIESDNTPKEKAYVTSSAKEQKGRTRKIVLTVLGILLAAGVATAGITYYLELWGGKTVPDVTGLTAQEATEVLEASGFTVRTTQVRSDGAEGLVLIEDPVGNSRHEEGSEVVIHISVSRSIPQIVGMMQDEAQALIDEEGLTNVSIETMRSDETEGKVLSVTPEQGTRVRSNQAVVVTVATPFTVPEIANMSLSEVQAAITDAGLTYDYYYTYTEDYPDYTVIGVYPEVGTKVTGGSTVTINIARARATALINATQEALKSGTSISVNGVNYMISSLDNVSYLGENKTSYTVTAAPYVYLLGEYVYGTSRSISGTITWNDDDTIASIS